MGLGIDGCDYAFYAQYECAEAADIKTKVCTDEPVGFAPAAAGSMLCKKGVNPGWGPYGPNFV